jgi:uncharacterized protein YcgI (DUF1989 family)
VPETGLLTIPARGGLAIRLRSGRALQVVNTHGHQVVDTWAFCDPDLTERMSMEHTRAALFSLFVSVGQSLVTNRRRPIVTLMEDSSPGVHDTLIAACDRYRYEQLGCTTHHENCTDNLVAALAEIGLAAPETPSPWNLFMNIPVVGGRRLEFRPPVSKPGDYLTLRAERDCVLVFSACPQDLLPVNAGDPVEAHVRLLGGASCASE